MANHLSTVKTRLALMGLSTHAFDDLRIRYFQKAMILHRSFKASLKKEILKKHFMPSDVQVPSTPLMQCGSLKKSKVMAPGHRNAFGNTSQWTITPLTKWPELFNANYTLPPTWGLGLLLHNKFSGFSARFHKKCFPLIKYEEISKLTRIKFLSCQIGV